MDISIAIADNFVEKTLKEELNKKRPVKPAWRTINELEGFGSRNVKGKDNENNDLWERVWAKVEEGHEIANKCDACDYSPCIWRENRDRMICFDNFVSTKSMPINVRRKYMYQKMNSIIKGVPMGKGNRERLPTCCEKGIREIYPDPDGSYMGYRSS